MANVSGATDEIDESTAAILPAPSLQDVHLALELGWDLNRPVASMPPLREGRRLAALQALIARNAGLDAFLVTDLVNIRALTGFTGSAAKLMVTADHSTLLTDGRYEEQAADETTAAEAAVEIVIRRTTVAQSEWLAEFLRARSITSLGLEAATISWSAQQSLASIDERMTCVPMFHLVERLRRTKSTGEIARTARAAAIADAAIVEVAQSLVQRPTERTFQRSLDDAMLALGADAVSFETIVASGPNASRPHHEPGDRRVEIGDEVICDFGALVNGYHSDMTRTLYVGPPTTAQRHHFDVVRAAHDAGVAALVPGAHCVDVDRAARHVCEQAGWGDEFVHGLGHGTGLVIHELPWLGQTSRNVIAHGDLVTIEPGVYFPGGGGVRIEDLYVITTDGPIALSRAPIDMVVSLA